MRRRAAGALAGAIAAICCAVPPVGAVPDSLGALTGGGFIDNPDFRTTFGAALPCDPARPAQNLEINWPRHRFKLQQVTRVECAFDPEDPRGGGSQQGQGIGSCDGQMATVDWSFTDGGSARRDQADLEITALNPDCQLHAIGGTLGGGNIQVRSG